MLLQFAPFPLCLQTGILTIKTFVYLMPLVPDHIGNSKTVGCHWQSSSTTGCHWRSSSTTGCHWQSSSTDVTDNSSSIDNTWHLFHARPKSFWDFNHIFQTFPLLSISKYSTLQNSFDTAWACQLASIKNIWHWQHLYNQFFLNNHCWFKSKTCQYLRVLRNNLCLPIIIVASCRGLTHTGHI